MIELLALLPVLAGATSIGTAFALGTATIGVLAATLAANAARTQNIGSFAIVARSLFTPSQAATTASAPREPAASATT